MSESYVYIDAPSLDNSDQSKFTVNKDFQYVQAGDPSKGNVAQFPLYEKFLNNNEFNTSINAPGLTRQSFIEDDVVFSETGYSVTGGDYINGNVCVVISKIFKVGYLKGFNFRIFAANSYTDYDYQNISKVAIFSMSIENGQIKRDLYDLVGYAYYEPSDDNPCYFKVDREIKITGEMLNLPEHAFCFVFLKNNKDISDDHKLSVNRDTLQKNYCDENDKVRLRGLPRGGVDNKSCITKKAGQNGAFKTFDLRILDFDYYLDVDSVDEYIGINYNSHHISSNEIKDLNILRYAAPAIVPGQNYTKKIVSTPWCNEVNSLGEKYKGWVKISDKSLTRNNKFNLLGKPVTSIKIPFFASSDSNDFVKKDSGDATVQGGFTNTTHSYYVTNREILIALEEDENGFPKWIPGDDMISISYYKEDTVYEVTFKNYKNRDELLYKGNGIWIAARPPKKVDGTFENGRFNFPFHCWVKNGTLNECWTYNQDETDYDYVHWTDYTVPTEDNEVSREELKNRTKLRLTPNIKVIFDYQNRGEWFDYIESSANNGSGGSVIEGNSISLGDWRIAVNTDGNLEIYHISATEDKDKSIFYIPTSN